MNNLGFDAYRFSISWSRMLPGENLNYIYYKSNYFRYEQLFYNLVLGGNLSSGINRQSIAYYNNLINELLSEGLKLISFINMFSFLFISVYLGI